MHRNTNISPGENLKTIRKKMGLKQHEIVGKDITRNLVSLIENNKTPLNEKTAKIIAMNINHIAHSNKVNLRVDPEDFFDIERFNIKQVIDGYIDKINENLLLENAQLLVNEVEGFLIKKNIPDKKAEVYEKIADYFFQKASLHNAYVYYIKSFENATRVLATYDICSLILKLTRCCIRLNKNNEATSFSSIALACCDESTNEITSKIIFNRALAYRNLAQFDMAIAELEKLESYLSEKDGSKYIDILTVKAACFKELKDYKTAINIHRKIQNLLSEQQIEEKIIVLGNIMEIECKMDNSHEVRHCLDVIQQLRNKMDKDTVYSPYILFEIACAYEYLMQKEDCKAYLEKSLNIALKYSNIDIQIKSITRLLELYKQSNEENKIDLIKEIIMDWLSKRIIETNNPLIFKLILICNEMGGYEKVNEIVSCILSKEKF